MSLTESTSYDTIFYIFYYCLWCLYKLPVFPPMFCYYILSISFCVLPSLYILKRSVVCLAELTPKCLRTEYVNIGGKLISDMKFLKRRFRRNRNKRVPLTSRGVTVLCCSRRSIYLCRSSLPPPEFWLSYFGCYSKVHLPYLCLTVSVPHVSSSSLLPLFSHFSISYFLSLPSPYLFHLQILHDFI